MRCQTSQAELKVGNVLRDARERQGLSQRRLALRAGTSQDAISRIERGVESPTMERFTQLLLALGCRPRLSVEPLEAPLPQAELAAADSMTPRERLREASSWNLMAARLAIAGEQARSEGHPSTARHER